MLRRLLLRFRNSASFALLVSAVAGSLGATVVTGAAAHDSAATAHRWSDDERKLLASLSLRSLAPLQADPSNRYGDDPRAAALGERLFADTRLSGNGKVSCATCHVPSLDFQDGVPLA